MTHQIGTYDHTTGEQTTREMTIAEIAAYEKEVADRAAAKAAKLAEKESAKTALLTSLGITEAQAITLGLLQAAPQQVEHLTDSNTQPGGN
jgi:hypothetical protein